MTEALEKKETKKKQQTAERVDFGKVLVIAPSGYGKTFMAKTADRDTTGVINSERKPLSFKAEFKFHGRPKTWTAFLKNLEDYGNNPEVENIFVDSQSMAFETLHSEMQNNYKGYDVYSNYNRELVKYFNIIRDIKKDIIVCSHDESLVTEGYRQRRAKVQGKQFEGRVEAFYTVVLFADKRLKDNKPQYFLRTFEPETSTKTPEGMFGELLEIPNDAGFIFTAVKEYYSN